VDLPFSLVPHRPIRQEPARQRSTIMPSLKHTVGWVRICGIMEGISYLLLLGIAMPLKYFFDQPLAVTYVGWAHGALFMLYCLAILIALLASALSFPRSVMAFVASLLPFGPFIIDRKLAGDEAREKIRRA
jgi:integral membrane protein